MEEKSGWFGVFPGGMAMADLFGPLTTPVSAVDFRDKIKITIKSNAGVKCLKVSKPCDTLAISHATDPKSCDFLKTSLPSPPAGLEGSMVESQPYLKMSPSSCSEGQESNKTEERNPAYMKGEGLSCRGGRCSSTNNKLCAAAGGSHHINTHHNEESGKGADNTETDKTQSNYREECLQSTKDKMSLQIKEEPLSEEEGPSDHMSRNLKKEPVSDVEDNLADRDKSFYIKEEPPFSDKGEDPNNIDETQIIPIKIKEEPTSSEEESDVEEESPSHQAGGPSTSSRGTQTMWSWALEKERILPRTLPLVIRNPQLTDRRMALPKETKTGLLKKLMELGTPANDNAQEMRTLTCTPVKMYKCSKCGRYFTSRLRLKRHNLAHKKYKVACPDCGRLFACKATVLRHQVVHSNQKPFPCSFCEKSFSTDKGREIHERRHTGDKPFICSECGKNFLFKAQLETHQMIHTGERYSCHECGRCYRTKPGLVLHMRIHQGDVPYFCPECGKGFVQKSNLKNHLHTHSKEKPFTCLECGKAFRQKYNLKQHMSVHVAKEREKYSCPECEKSYKRKADYRWHMLIHLGEKSSNVTKIGPSGL